ncbi:MAG: hypothetical protein ACTSYA_03935 [Candidatus Kariarchaeaceae archaeon]
MSDEKNGKEEETKYMGRILTAAQDRRFSTAMDIWAVILHSSVRYTYFNEEGKKINGLTAKDLATRLNMTLSSVYHNLKLLRSEEINLLETNEVIDETSQRKIKQTVYSIPRKYEEEFLELYYYQVEEKGIKRFHKELSYFNTLKLKGILSHYSSLLHRDRLLVDEESNRIKDWYSRWLKPLDFETHGTFPVALFLLEKEEVSKVISAMNKAINEIFKERGEDEEREETISFAYFLFPAYTEEMIQNEWLNKEEYEERVKELKSQKVEMSCEEDHETFFKYDMECPVCGAKRSEK